MLSGLWEVVGVRLRATVGRHYTVFLTIPNPPGK